MKVAEVSQKDRGRLNSVDTNVAFLSAEAEIDVRMREEFSKVCFETLLQFSFSNKVSTPQEGYISRMALSVLLKRAQDVLRRYVEDERLSGRCPLPRYVCTLCHSRHVSIDHKIA